MAQEIHFILYNLPEGDSLYKLLSNTAKYDIFNKTQQIDSDFDKEIRGMLNKPE